LARTRAVFGVHDRLVTTRTAGFGYASRMPTTNVPRAALRARRPDRARQRARQTATKLHVHIFVGNKGDYYELGDGLEQREGQ
jgi:hypothetical protein